MKEQKLELENLKKIQHIKDVENVKKSFGKRYVLVDNKNNKYWLNKAVEGFIKEHKNVKNLKLITSEFKSFLKKKGKK